MSVKLQGFKMDASDDKRQQYLEVTKIDFGSYKFTLYYKDHNDLRGLCL